MGGEDIHLQQVPDDANPPAPREEAGEGPVVGQPGVLLGAGKAQGG